MAPTRSTSEQDLDQFNSQMRAQPWYQQARARMGPGDLSRGEQSELEVLMAQNGMGVEGGMHVDAGGNVNQKNRLVRNAAIAAGIAAGGYFAAPAIAGALGAGGAASGGAAAGGIATGGASGLSAGMLPGITAGLGTAGGAGAVGAGGGLLGTLGTVGRLGQRGMDMGNALTQGSQGLGAGRQQDTQNDAMAAGLNNRANLDAAQFNLDAPAQRASQVARGGVLRTMQNAAPTGDPRIDKFGGGGLRPSAMTDQARQAGGQLERDALLALMQGSDRVTPQTVKPRRASGGENLMAGAGMGLNLLGMLGGRR